eukprot:2308590-Rhodomonas_salina.2
MHAFRHKSTHHSPISSSESAAAASPMSARNTVTRSSPGALQKSLEFVPLVGGAALPLPPLPPFPPFLAAENPILPSLGGSGGAKPHAWNHDRCNGICAGPSCSLLGEKDGFVAADMVIRPALFTATSPGMKASAAAEKHATTSSARHASRTTAGMFSAPAPVLFCSFPLMSLSCNGL